MGESPFSFRRRPLDVHYMITNNVTRLLDAKRISYQAFELPNEKLGALEVAQHLGVEPGLVYKSIVVTREGKAKPILAVIPGNSEVDLKALAIAVGDKKVCIPTEKEAERLSGFRAGGISPLALFNKGFLIILDQSAMEHPAIFISGGQRGLNILLSVLDLVSITGSQYSNICRTVE